MRGDANILDKRPGIALIDETYLLCVGKACLFLYPPEGFLNERLSGCPRMPLPTPSAMVTFPLAIAASIAAPAVGDTFAFSAFGVWLGSRFGERYKARTELTGGVILIIMGTKILLELLGMIGG